LAAGEPGIEERSIEEGTDVA